MSSSIKRAALFGKHITNVNAHTITGEPLNITLSDTKIGSPSGTISFRISSPSPLSSTVRQIRQYNNDIMKKFLKNLREFGRSTQDFRFKHIKFKDVDLTNNSSNIHIYMEQPPSGFLYDTNYGLPNPIVMYIDFNIDDNTRIGDIHNNRDHAPRLQFDNLFHIDDISDDYTIKWQRDNYNSWGSTGTLMTLGGGYLRSNSRGTTTYKFKKVIDTTFRTETKPEHVIYNEIKLG